VINTTEQFFGVGRFALSSLANIGDIREELKSRTPPVIPPEALITVTFLLRNQDVRVWRGWRRADDTEECIRVNRRGRPAERVVGSVRRRESVGDHGGIGIIMTDNRKEVTMQYFEGDSTERKELQIAMFVPIGISA
jgi:hypothetical protein